MEYSDANLVDLYNQGLTYTEIAEQLGVPRGGLSRRLRRLRKQRWFVLVPRLHSRRANQEPYNADVDMVRMYNQGLSYSDIAEKLGATVGKVAGHLYRVKCKDAAALKARQERINPLGKTRGPAAPDRWLVPNKPKPYAFVIKELLKNLAKSQQANLEEV